MPIMSSDPMRHRIVTTLCAAVAGLLAGAIGLVIAHLLAQFHSPDSSPVVAVGGAAIDASPRWLKEFAIRNFGTNDKHVLLLGILVTLAVLTMVIGAIALNRMRVALAVILVLGVVAIIAELRRPTATATYPIPTVIGLAAGALILSVLTRPLRRIQLAHTEDESRAPVDKSLVRGSRREFLFASLGVTAAAAVALTAANAISRSKAATAARRAVKLPPPATPATALPAAVDLNLSGLSTFITPNEDFYRVDTALVVPQVDPRHWRLKITGLVDHPFTVTLDELLAMPLIERDITLTCVSNEVGGPYVGNARWLGVPLKTLMNRAGVQPAANQFLSTSTDGFTTSTPVELALDGRDAMIALGMNGEPLPVAHGFPARLVVPGLYGYVSACKWITSIEATTYNRHQAYWTQRGWDINGPILTQTRVDVPHAATTIKAGTVPVAGVAWAQHRGIERVEVSIDGGEWQPATLAATPGIDTWRQWWYRWEATPGNHRIRARSTDATGLVQPSNPTDPFPRGATGYPEVFVTVA